MFENIRIWLRKLAWWSKELLNRISIKKCKAKWEKIMKRGYEKKLHSQSICMKLTHFLYYVNYMFFLNLKGFLKSMCRPQYNTILQSVTGPK